MEKRYYLVKVAIIVLAVITAGITSGFGSSRVSHALGHARYTAPAEIESAAWHATAYIAHTISHLLDSSTNRQP